MMAIPMTEARARAKRIRRAVDQMVRSVSIDYPFAGSMMPVRAEEEVDPAALRLFSFPRNFRQL